MAFLASSFGVSNGAGSETAHIYEGLENASNLLALSLTNSPNAPRAYLMCMVFDQDYVLIDPTAGGYDFYAPVPEAAATETQNISLKIDIPENAKYIYTYVANESAGTHVFFDDFTVAQLGVDITQTTDYYPFGSVASHWQKEDYRYGYQGEYAEEDEETGFNHFEARKYDARINRWLSMDPMRQYYSGYVGMGNNWMNKVDPDGRCDECPDDPTVTMWVNPTDPNFTTYVRDGRGEWVRETGILDGEIIVTAKSGSGQFIPKLPFFFYTPPDPTTYLVFDPVTNIITIGNGQMEDDYWLGKHNGGRSNMVRTAMFDMLALTGQKSAGRFQKPGGPPGRIGYIGNLMDQYKDAMKPKLTPDTIPFDNGNGHTLLFPNATDTSYNWLRGVKTPRSSSGPAKGNFSPFDEIP